MKFISLSEQEETTLQECYRNHPKHHVRMKCQALLLNSKGQSIPALCRSVLKVRTRTVYQWLNRWGQMGIAGLFIQKGRGVKAKLVLDDESTSGLIKKSRKVR